MSDFRTITVQSWNTGVLESSTAQKEEISTLNPKPKSPPPSIRKGLRVSGEGF